MSESMDSLNRRRFLVSAIALPALAGLLTVSAIADGSKATQASMRYQSTPNGSMQCSGCRFFIAGKDPTSSGSCQVVDGSISPNGYCMGYSAKSS